MRINAISHLIDSIKCNVIKYVLNMLMYNLRVFLFVMSA